MALYTDFSGDIATAQYTFILGAQVKSGATAPEGMVTAQVPPGEYLEFTSEQGALSVVVPNQWNAITQYFKQPGTPHARSRPTTRYMRPP